MRFLIVLFVGILWYSPLAQAQDPPSIKHLPSVINVAQNSAALEELSNQYQSSLFSASNADFVETVRNWRDFLHSIELYSNKIDFDIKGVKVWMKVFWAKDGTIDHITYALSDRSINIDLVEWDAFLRSFIRNNKLGVTHERNFTYDGRIMFPLSYAQPGKN